MTITDADEAIDADLEEMQLVDQSPATEGTVVDIGSTPCTADEARALIGKAASAANDFYEAVGELLSRKGYLALGYDSPRQMLSRELAGVLTNPRTGKPLSDTHLRRMTRVAWLAWSIAQTTGIDMSQLQITERQVRSISAASAGVDDLDLIEDINGRLMEVGANGPDQVNEIVENAISTYVERQSHPDPDEDDEADLEGPTPRGGSNPSDGAASSSDQNSKPGAKATPGGGGDDDYEEGEDDVPADRPPAPPAPKPSVTSLFDTEMPDSVPVVSDFDVSSALVHMRTAADVRRVMQDAVRILDLLPTIAKIEKTVPHVIDAIDDDDLDALRNELVGTERATKWATQTLDVITAALTEVDIRIDEAI